MMSAFEDFAKALAQIQNQPTLTYEALYALTNELIGVKLFTLTELDSERKEARRIYSNMPEAYPLLGIKQVTEDAWSRQVLVQHQTFVANSIEDIAQVFSDFELIRSLGCESALNIPIVVGGQILGTINCLHDAGHYTPERFVRSHALKASGAAAFLFLKSKLIQGGDQ